MLEKEVSTGCELLTYEPNEESYMFLRLLKLNFQLLVPLGAIDRFIQVLEVAERCTRGEDIIRYGAFDRSSSRARRCLLRLLRSHPVFKSRQSPGSNQYFLHTSVTLGGE